MLHNQREFTTACKFLEHSCNLHMKYHGPSSLHTATGHHLVARVLSALGEYKAALNNEKTTYGIYQKHVSIFDLYLFLIRLLESIFIPLCFISLLVWYRGC